MSPVNGAVQQNHTSFAMLVVPKKRQAALDCPSTPVVVTVQLNAKVPVPTIWSQIAQLSAPPTRSALEDPGADGAVCEVEDCAAEGVSFVGSALCASDVPATHGIRTSQGK
jgi:hypothetical protein